MKHESRSVQSVENIGRLLELFTVDNPEIGVTQAAQRLGMSKSSVHALLTAMTRIGLLHRFVTGRYRLGFQVMALNTVLMSHTPWRRIAREEMTHLAEALGESVHLAAFDGGQAICIDKVEGNAPLVNTPIGGILPPHATALGKIILAHQPISEIQQLYDSGHQWQYTPNTITSHDELLSDLKHTRERGYAISIEERAMGLCSIAAPIRDPNGEVIAAMSVSLSTRHFQQRKASVITHLQAATASTSRRIGYDSTLDNEDGLYWHSINGKATLRRTRLRREEKP
ncbi:IclR family transcriptional regulator [Deinococcus deserti]|uniref:Putative transcriptional regulator, IclR family n=1 Tax=Deinococcus deserti (strain DSM 17065 / CIP 109153 / LMG 22923 / VCD115) TaxID=546414 RepID=C1D2E2_DEIDV|nr:IclR family transcriptional regulator [Deinococcus deserti]ACO47581.1 putative transcriptional regulator, IclR family [Deinococcus deserti VCD115]